MSTNPPSLEDTIQANALGDAFISGVIIALFIFFSILCIGTEEKFYEAECDDACRQEFGDTVEGQHSPRARICDCVSPDGTIRRPREP